jgi:AcrR family transcriptional regulator
VSDNGTSSQPSIASKSIEVEFERFFRGIRSSTVVPDESSLTSESIAASPRTTIEAIYDRALAIIDADGVEALSARRLAADLRVSTRTLYKRIGNRDSLIRAVTEQHFATVRLRDCTGELWEAAALSSCTALHDALCAHPHLTSLMSEIERKEILNDVGGLVALAVADGIAHETAVQCCRTLVNIAINDAIAQARYAQACRLPCASGATKPGAGLAFDEAVMWILAGIRAGTSAQVP